MNQSSNETSGISLPPPVSEQLPVNAEGGEAVVPVAEKPAASPESAAANERPAASAPAISMPVPADPAAIAQQTDVTTTPTTVVPNATDDGDLIEKEWVNKARQIVEGTRDNPYQQSEELTVVKAEYMKKRYDKVIKLSK